jgi:ABC-type Fe3+/spermidine/putrescine transport system ATPase subunit
MVRPEAVVIARDGAGLAGVVRSAFFMGMTTEYLLETPAGEVLATRPYRADWRLTSGQEVRLRFEEGGVYLLPADTARKGSG